jgi:hypothetical protein
LEERTSELALESSGTIGMIEESTADFIALGGSGTDYGGADASRGSEYHDDRLHDSGPSSST